jgi:hypothetical protein
MTDTTTRPERAEAAAPGLGPSGRALPPSVPGLDPAGRAVAPAEFEPGPSGPGSVVLDIGVSVGALVLHAPAALNGREIEISPDGDLDALRTHSQVRERRIAGRPVYAAVYPGLTAGRYIIWRDAGGPAGTVAITGGQVTEWHWP